MATLAPLEPSPSPPLARRSKAWARRCERYCWTFLTLFPLVAVYSLTTWAVWVQTNIGLLPAKGYWTGHAQGAVGLTLYLLLNWSYTVAVFTDPGSTLSGNASHTYSSLPTTSSDHGMTSSLTVKSTGTPRYCKKCQARKPDRAHHCSTCKRCVLKMDHHCPWLATCVGLRNYKPFVLFLIYTVLFCWVCFAASATWALREIIGETHFGVDPNQRLMPVNFILLAVLAGVLGLVLAGFTGWHLYLCCIGQTTIESLEKTRYLSPLKRSMAAQLHAQEQRHYVNGTPNSNGPTEQPLTDTLREIHANALPGITRPEEGISPSQTPSPRPPQYPSPARDAMQTSYSMLEAQRERDRYESYLDEQASEALPNAFDHGWRANLRHVFGHVPLLWFLPVCNTTGDGYNWQASSEWVEAREQMARERVARQRENEALRREERGWVDRAMPLGSSDRTRQMQRMSVRDGPLQSSDDGGDGIDDVDEDEDEAQRRQLMPKQTLPSGQWNDLPAEMLPPRGNSRAGMRPRSPRSVRAYPNR